MDRNEKQRREKAFAKLSTAMKRVIGDVGFDPRENTLVEHLREVLSNRASLPSAEDLGQYSEIVRLYLIDVLERHQYVDTDMVELYHELRMYGRKPTDQPRLETVEEKIHDVFNKTIVERSYLLTLKTHDIDGDDADALAKAGAQIADQFNQLYELYQWVNHEEDWFERLKRLRASREPLGGQKGSVVASLKGAA